MKTPMKNSSATFSLLHDQVDHAYVAEANGAGYGKFHNQGDAKWIVISRQLRGHNDTPFGCPTPSWPIGHPEVGYPQGVIGVFKLLLISDIIL
jgi:hypothetical protein